MGICIGDLTDLSHEIFQIRPATNIFTFYVTFRCCDDVIIPISGDDVTMPTMTSLYRSFSILFLYVIFLESGLPLRGNLGVKGMNRSTVKKI